MLKETQPDMNRLKSFERQMETWTKIVRRQRMRWYWWQIWWWTGSARSSRCCVQRDRWSWCPCAQRRSRHGKGTWSAGGHLVWIHWSTSPRGIRGSGIPSVLLSETCISAQSWSRAGISFAWRTWWYLSRTAKSTSFLIKTELSVWPQHMMK
jgi:hypothetical protein